MDRPAPRRFFVFNSWLAETVVLLASASLVIMLRGSVRICVSSGVRRTTCAALGAMLLICASTVPASARQETSTPPAPAKKSASASTGTKKKSTTSKRSASKTHHATASSSHQAATSPHSTTATRTTSAHHSPVRHASRRSLKKAKSTRARGQQRIDPERATSIQEALIREHYLTGEPTGVWDGQSVAAMRRYQSDQGWQTKEVPDSRALIKLGLGPTNDHLLNPESAMTSTPIARPPGPAARPSRSSPVTAPAASTGDAPPSAKDPSAPEIPPAAQPNPAAAPQNPASGDSPNPQLQFPLR